jgi:hypothetical protein
MNGQPRRRMRDAPPTCSADRDGRGAQRAPSREVWPEADAGGEREPIHSPELSSGLAVGDATASLHSARSPKGEHGIWGRQEARSPKGEHWTVGATPIRRTRKGTKGSNPFLSAPAPSLYVGVRRWHPSVLAGSPLRAAGGGSRGALRRGSAQRNRPGIRSPATSAIAAIHFNDESMLEAQKFMMKRPPSSASGRKPPG